MKPRRTNVAWFLLILVPAYRVFDVVRVLDWKMRLDVFKNERLNLASQ